MSSILPTAGAGLGIDWGGIGLVGVRGSLVLHRAEEQHRGDQPEELDEGDAQAHSSNHIQLSGEPALEGMSTALVPPQGGVLRSKGYN